MARRGAERVQEGDAVVLSVNGGARHALICAQPGATVRLGKHAHASAADVVGAPYGSTLELSPSCSSLQRVRNARDPAEAGGVPEPSPAEEGKSNKQLTDSNSKQGLSSSDIHQLKQHHTGDAIVHSLAKNSVSFEEKTVFSQEKWKQRKLRRHSAILTVCTPSTDVIASAYFAHSPRKIGFLRPNALSSLLFFADAVPQSRCLVVDGCGGLVTGAVAQRLGGYGIVASCVHPVLPQRFDTLKYLRLGTDGWNSIRAVDLPSLTRPRKGTARDLYEFPHNERDLTPVKCGNGNTIEHDFQDVQEDAEKNAWQNADGRHDLRGTDVNCSAHSEAMRGSSFAPEDLDKGRQRMYSRVPMQFASSEEVAQWRAQGFNSCIVCHPSTDVLATLLEMFKVLQPSSPFAVWSPTIEPLAEARLHLGRSKKAVDLHLQEPWQRPYQILPQRTHPHMNIDASAGYILSGYFLDETNLCNHGNGNAGT